MERKTYNQEIIDRVAKYEANMANPTLTGEEVAEMAKEKHWQDIAKHKARIYDLIQKLDEVEGKFIDHTQCVWWANRLMRNIPPELEQNIDEWIDDKPLTDIKVHGWSIADIINHYGKKRIVTFLEAVKCMGDWHASGYQDDEFCVWYFTTM